MYLIVSVALMACWHNDLLSREVMLKRVQESERRYLESLKGQHISYVKKVTSPNGPERTYVYDFYCDQRGFVCLKSVVKKGGKLSTIFMLANDKYTATVTQDDSSSRYLLSRLEYSKSKPIQILDSLDHVGILGPTTFFEFFVSAMFEDSTFQFIEASKVGADIIRVQFGRGKYLRDTIELQERPDGKLFARKWESTVSGREKEPVAFRTASIEYSSNEDENKRKISGYSLKEFAHKSGECTLSDIGSEFKIDVSSLNESQFFLRGYGLTDPAGSVKSDTSNVLHWVVYGVAAIALIYFGLRLRRNRRVLSNG